MVAGSFSDALVGSRAGKNKQPILIDWRCFWLLNNSSQNCYYPDGLQRRDSAVYEFSSQVSKLEHILRMMPTDQVRKLRRTLEILTYNQKRTVEYYLEQADKREDCELAELNMFDYFIQRWEVHSLAAKLAFIERFESVMGVGTWPDKSLAKCKGINALLRPELLRRTRNIALVKSNTGNKRITVADRFGEDLLEDFSLQPAGFGFLTGD